jgi:PIN domain nuclease of toxin-antitoxin system
MEDIAYLDTHVVIWLYAGRLDLFNNKIQALIENSSIRISPILELELQYLLELATLYIIFPNYSLLTTYPDHPAVF